MKIHKLLIAGAFVLASSTAFSQTTPIAKGRSVAQVHANFPGYIVQNFSRVGATTLLTKMSDNDLAQLTKYYYLETQGKTSPLTNLIASTVTDPVQLKRYAAAMGKAPTDTAVATFASLATQAKYFSGNTPAVIKYSPAASASMGIKVTANPNIDMTLYEIYLDFLTDSANVSRASALISAARFSSMYLGLAYYVGTQIGGGLWALSDHFTPGANIWVSDGIGTVIDYVMHNSNPGVEITIGDVEGLPSTTTGH